ncbi:MAG: glycine zipper 2TM domain-containing protein [Phenylobacterium sp.]
MTRTALVAGLAAALAIPSFAAPVSAQARSYCEQRAHNRKVGGTIIGALAGGLLGNAVSHGGGKTGGTIIGAGVGAVAGNNLARINCDRPHAYYRHRTHSGYAANDYRYSRSGYGYAAPARCHYETRSYYDARGRLVYAPTQVCG